MLHGALSNLSLPDIELLFVENVGNLVCPAEFALGENLKILISSVPEGDDKPYKYPLMFHEADVVILNKIDLLPYVNFDMGTFTKGIKGINTDAKLFITSCTTGEGIEDWISWLLSQINQD
jgi:hydrogenase nickel incorporation protein HypB